MNPMGYELIINGNQEAFAQIVEHFQNPVYNMCYRMLGNQQEAEDAAQETFWRAYKNMHRYDTKRKFATWLLSIAAHYCIDQQRKKRIPSIDINEIIEYSAEDPAPNPECIAIKNELSEEIQQQLAGLNESDKAVLILRYWYQMSECEISDTMNISRSAVKSRLHRARKHMAEQWKNPQDGIAKETIQLKTQTDFFPKTYEKCKSEEYRNFSNSINSVRALR
jgi:RNA polymerase sigma-70 factor, ECF subfamily